jgi:hypothetical protein
MINVAQEEKGIRISACLHPYEAISSAGYLIVEIKLTLCSRLLTLFRKAKKEIMAQFNRRCSSKLSNVLCELKYINNLDQGSSRNEK